MAGLERSEDNQGDVFHKGVLFYKTGTWVSLDCCLVTHTHSCGRKEGRKDTPVAGLAAATVGLLATPWAAGQVQQTTAGSS